MYGKLLDSLNKNDIFSKKLFYFTIKVVHVQILVFYMIPLVLKHHFNTLWLRLFINTLL